MLIMPSKFNKIVRLPSSKSYLHRAIILSALCDGTNTLSNVWLCDDINCTIEAMRQFGANITYKEHTLTITGVSRACGDIEVYCKESGSTLRFLIPLFASKFNRSVFHCEKGLVARPLCAYEGIFPSLCVDKQSYTVCVSKTETAPQVEVSGDVSSQYITGLLLMYASCGGGKITIMPPFESRPYVDITIDMLNRFGIDAHFESEYTIAIIGGELKAPLDIAIEPDFSQLAFFAVAGVLCGCVKVIGLPDVTLQGDCKIIEIIRQCGGNISDDFEFTVSSLTAIEVDVKDCPDLFPILTVLLTHSVGSSKITGISRLKYKESDRVAAMVTELSKMGHDIRIVGDCVMISDKMTTPSTYTLCSHNDHRIAMALAVAVKASNFLFTINGFECISKSFPEFSI